MQDATTPLDDPPTPPAPVAAGRPAWEAFLQTFDAVALRDEILHPVRIIRAVPAEHVEAFLGILKQMFIRIIETVASSDMALQRRSETLLQLLPNNLYCRTTSPNQTNTRPTTWPDCTQSRARV